MINFLIPSPKSGGLIFWFTLFLMVSPPVIFSAESAPRYKQSTVVDFEGAMIEGKSRKPYSSYLTQQKESAYGDLHQWQPDITKILGDARKRLDKKL